MDTLLINKLKDILSKESSLYEEILELSIKKTTIIVEGKVSDLENITKMEQMLIPQIGRLENEREEIVNRLSQIMDIPSDDINISELTLRLDDAQSKALKESQINIHSIIEKLKASNDINSKLIRNSLDYIDFSINLFSSTGTNDSNYSNSGRVNNSKKRNFLDMKL